MVTVKFVQPDGSDTVIEVPVGTTIMRAALDNGVEGIQGDCGGACSCATCHCYIDPEFFDKLPSAEDTEISMIEFAVEPRETSRLGCQIELTEALDGIVVHLPESQY
ncbi:2Fe-2S iron-sulfur cluster-binding protein [Halioxenophilus sp. WMMB6]|uniref:2Fe-2S iron-sulfur cluster-binding protein n=1 Tax=Halioxenophilus sp. WMMB6 TaxID=3073815 RepID=UPI00295EA2CE|nr:2Fe-2S iron-sulfur cluster-binding protein [Halioxenophilus sp. WMMB6]